MSKQWGHGHISGKTEAMKAAAEAVKVLQDRDTYAMTIVHKLMVSHHDKELANEAHQAIRRSEYLLKIYCQAFWYGYDAGLFIEELPPMTKKAGAELLYTIARDHGWKGQNNE